MLKPRNELESYIVKVIAAIDDTDERQEYYIELEEKYGIPITISSDIFAMRKDLSEYNEFILYAITNLLKPNKLEEFYTDKEIKLYGNSKYKINKIKLPIKLPMFQVTPDQWIGVSDAKFLMQLRSVQMINYNADTQRALEIVLNGGREILRPSVNYKSVKEIADLYNEERFIPNTISLNINYDDESADFYFKDNELIIKEIKAFDIFDGYHRYLALASIYDKNPKFNYPIELRITNFSVSKAKQFIFQEDHQTKMKRVDAASFNQYDVGNMIVERINADTSSDLFNSINVGKGLVNAGIMAQVINKWYFVGEKPDRKDIILTSKKIKDALNDVVENKTELLEKRWKRYEIWLIIYGISKGYSSDKIVAALDNITKWQIKELSSHEQLYKKQETLIREVYGDDE